LEQLYYRYYNTKPKSVSKGVIVVCVHPKQLLIGHDVMVGEMVICEWLKTCKKWGLIYATLVHDYVLIWSSVVKMINKKCKLLQFASILHLLSEGRLMKVDYEGMKSLFKQLQVNNYPHKHWSNSLGWIMVKHMHNVMLDTMWWPMAKV
jgi:hypothetical protein